MSDFLAGVVRRGAGLASPVVMRPAVGPQQIPLSIPMAHPWAEPAREEVRATPHAENGSTMDSFPLQPAATIRTEREIPPIAPQAPDVGTAAQTPPRPPARMDEAGAISPAKQSVSTREELIRVVEKRAEPARIETPLRPAPKMPGLAEALKRPEPKRDAEPVVIQPQPAAVPAAVPGKRGAAESRNIEVKIGKVEIRSTQPPPAPATAKSPAKGGFDDLGLARKYLDRVVR